MEIRDKVALVTGGAAGIGRAIARRFGEEGASVVIADIDEEWGAEAVAEVAGCGAEAAFVRADVARDEDVQAMFGFAAREFGGVDILVNNAIEVGPDHFPDAPAEQWSRLLDVALRGAMLGIRHGLELMERRGGGAIVNVSSVAGLGTRPHSYPEYAAAKAAIVRLTDCLAPLVARNVRVNCVAPDWTATEYVAEQFAAMTPEERADARDGFGRPAPARFLEPREVAAAVVDVVRDDSLAGRTIVLWCGEAPRVLPGDRWE